ncbi:MAG TPA: SRPBCC family protein [Streptosporangiaceae bacterium]
MPITDPSSAFCLQRTGKQSTSWDTLLITGTADTMIPAEDLWTAWTDLPRWPDWSPLHRAVAWTSTSGMAAGAVFGQRISLGFPLGTTTQHVTIDLLEPARRVAWAGEGNGVSSCHLWSFTPLTGGGTHVSNVEAFTGLPVALLRPLVTRRWNRLFQAAVDGLIRHVSAAAEDASR